MFGKRFCFIEVMIGIQVCHCEVFGYGRVALILFPDLLEGVEGVIEAALIEIRDSFFCKFGKSTRILGQQ